MTPTANQGGVLVGGGGAPSIAHMGLPFEGRSGTGRLNRRRRRPQMATSERAGERFGARSSELAWGTRSETGVVRSRSWLPGLQGTNREVRTTARPSRSMAVASTRHMGRWLACRRCRSTESRSRFRGGVGPSSGWAHGRCRHRLPWSASRPTADDIAGIDVPVGRPPIGPQLKIARLQCRDPREYSLVNDRSVISEDNC